MPQSIHWQMGRYMHEQIKEHNRDTINDLLINDWGVYLVLEVQEGAFNR